MTTDNPFSFFNLLNSPSFLQELYEQWKAVEHPNLGEILAKYDPYIENVDAHYYSLKLWNEEVDDSKQEKYILYEDPNSGKLEQSPSFSFQEYIIELFDQKSTEVKNNVRLAMMNKPSTEACSRYVKGFKEQLDIIKQSLDQIEAWKKHPIILSSLCEIEQFINSTYSSYCRSISTAQFKEPRNTGYSFGLKRSKLNDAIKNMVSHLSDNNFIANERGNTGKFRHFLEGEPVSKKINWTGCNNELKALISRLGEVAQSKPKCFLQLTCKAFLVKGKEIETRQLRHAALPANENSIDKIHSAADFLKADST